MAGALPDGEPVAADGSLPASALADLRGRRFGVYVHVPFCASRCGYCDFNTYTAAELGGSAGRSAYAGQAIAEIRLARRVLGQTELPVHTVFFGGGTPTVLPAADLGAVLSAVDGEFGLAPGAEVTTEANPESVDADYLDRLRRQGFTRVSFGMQSARPHVLAVLDRAHRPGRPEACVAWARAAGFASVSLDLIYGTPGETAADWQASLDAALGAGPDHVSAYALIVEPGTRLARRVASGELTAPDDDEQADRYLQADAALAAGGLDWYEVSNWARPGEACLHNLGYWRGENWWGIGPGAHSHVGGVRWWNVKHPSSYGRRLGEGRSPAQAREVLTPEQRRLERVLLGLRLAEGHPLADLTRAGRCAAARAVTAGLLQAGAHGRGSARLTVQGRLLADALVRDLTD